DVTAWRARSRAFESLTSVGLGVSRLTVDGESERLSSIYFSDPVKQSLGVAPALGRDFLAAELKPGAQGAVLLSNGLFSRRFHSDAGVIGRSVSLDGDFVQV